MLIICFNGMKEKESATCQKEKESKYDKKEKWERGSNNAIH